MKRYEKYKPSGVEWLGEVPEHWEIKRLKFVGKLQGGIGFPHDYQNIQDLELQFYKVGDLGLSKNNRNMPKAQHTINNEVANLLGAKIIPPNSILYAKVGAALLLNRRRINDEKCCIDNNMTAFIPNFSNITTAWAFYSLSIIDFKVFVNPGAIPSLSEGYQENLQICVPPLEEQMAIVNYLDKKTEKIDRLISHQQALLEKLSEKRTALITETVCGRVRLPTALNDNKTLSGSNALLRNSGIEWLGEVPEHWETVNLKYLCCVKGGYAFASELFIDEGIPVIRISDILFDGTVDYKNCKKVSLENIPNHSDFQLKTGQFVMAMTGATIGKVSSYQSNELAYINQRVGKFELLTSKLNYQFLGYILKTSGYQEHIKLTAFGGAQPNISNSEIVDYKISLPLTEEQTAIVNYLDTETAKIDHLQNKIERVIERLKEYRSALITQVVTGKVKV